jgi:putative FmdB family regulatory protein
MPTYEYECDACHHRFDKRQGFKDKPISICPRCQGEAHRIFHAVPILFKGSGFYCTDHGRGWSGTAASEKEEPAEKPKPKKSGDGSTTKEPDKKGGNGSSPSISKGQAESVAADK